MDVLSFKFNGKDSFKDFGLVIDGTVVRPSTNANYNTENILGRKGTLNTFQYWNDNQIDIKLGYIKDSNITVDKSNILNWLNSKGDMRLYISDDRSLFYQVNKVSVSGFDGNNIKSFSVSFSLNPFTFLDEGKDIIEIKNPTTICNTRANVESEPYIKIYGSGDITVKINSFDLILKNVSDFIEVDSMIKNCYKTVNNKKVNCNNLMYSDFPIIELGENNISYTGNVQKIELIPRWCCW